MNPCPRASRGRGWAGDAAGPPTHARGESAMHAARRMIVLGVGAGIAALVVTAVSSPAQGRTSDSTYKENKLVADTAGAGAATVDSQLVNPWGLSAGPSSPLWVSDNGTDVVDASTAAARTADADHERAARRSPSPGGAPDRPGVQRRPAFSDVAGSPALFIFDGENGHITAWNSGTPHGRRDDGAARKTAVYKGLATRRTARSGRCCSPTELPRRDASTSSTARSTRLHVGELFTDPHAARPVTPRSASRRSARPST